MLRLQRAVSELVTAFTPRYIFNLHICLKMGTLSFPLAPLIKKFCANTSEKHVQAQGFLEKAKEFCCEFFSYGRISNYFTPV